MRTLRRQKRITDPEPAVRADGDGAAARPEVEELERDARPRPDAAERARSEAGEAEHHAQRAVEAAERARAAAEQGARLSAAAVKALRDGLRDGGRALARELRRQREEAADRDRPTTSFSDLAWAHWRWERERNTGGPLEPALREEYERRLKEFQERHGEIAEAYWSIRDASAVALTERTTRRTWRRLWRVERIPRFFRATEWATRDEPAIAAALDHCEVLAVKASEVLRGASEQIALRRVIAVASHLLGFVDRTRGRPPRSRLSALPRRRRNRARHDLEAARVAAEQEHELAKIERFYDRAGDKQARIVYFMGMVAGLACLLPLATAVAAIVWAVDGLDGPLGEHWSEIHALLVAIVAGALGSLLSVLIRMASIGGSFELDYEVGRKLVRWLGFFRPWLGAIFGVATYLLLASGILQTNPPEADVELFYYGALAFLAGFFERFMKIAPGGVPTPLEEEVKTVAETTPRAAVRPERLAAAAPARPRPDA